MNIAFGKPMIDKKEIMRVVSTLRGPQLVHGRQTKKFEDCFVDFVGGGYATSLSSCTAGLHLSYKALGISKGDEVIIPALTHVATAHSVEYVGAKPVFIDSEIRTGNLNLDLIEKKINLRTKAICVVHYLGMPIDMTKILNLVKKYKLYLIEDCALALGAKYKKKHVGLFGDVASFSFYPVKHITTAEGGMLLSKNKIIVEKIKKLKAFGYDKSLNDRKVPGKYNVNYLGYNFRMNEIEAAIGIEQMKKLPNFLKKRKENMLKLRNLIKFKDINFMYEEKEDFLHANYCALIILEKKLAPKRDLVIKKLIKKKIGCSIYYPGPIPFLNFYKNKYNFDINEFKNSKILSNNSIALPVGPHLSPTNMNTIVRRLREVIEDL